MFKTIIFFVLFSSFSVFSHSKLSKEDEKAVQNLQAAADEMAAEVAKINKRHSKDYFKKRVGEIFIFCSNEKYTDKVACIKPRVEMLTQE
jgi:outer membrane lipoprotein-sorting protein